MMKTEREIIDFLNQTGHLRTPFNKALRGPWPTETLTLESPQVEEAIASYQALWTPELQQIKAVKNPDVNPVVSVTGKLDSDTEDLLNIARCACPDYYPGADMAIGKGNWPSCWGASGFHRVIVNVITSGIPAFLKPVWEEVKARVKAAYREMGLDVVFQDNLAENANWNLKMTFVEPDGEWIGLALVLNGQKCNQRGWCRFDHGYKPSNILSEWTTLIMHELGHNCGLSHSTGGVMNPYIIKALPGSWRGDPSEPLLKARFGGVPVPGDGNGGPTPGNRDLITAWYYPDGRLEIINRIPHTGPLPGPFPPEISN